MVSTLLLVNVDADIVDEAVRRTARIRGADPRCALPQIGVHLRQRHAPIPVEVDELNVAEHAIVAEDVDLEMTRDRILPPVVGFARLEHEVVQLGDVEILTLEDLFGQARLEKLTTRQSRHDVADAFLGGEVRGQRVDRLKAAIADVGEALEAVDKDLVHVWCTTHDELEAQRVHDPTDVGLGFVRDEAVVQGEDERRQPEVAELIQHVRAVLAAAQ